jgi:site-specific DNA-cytosine methylase
LVSIAPRIKPGERGKKYHPTRQRFSALRLEWDRPAPTLIANALRSSSLVLHPDIDVGISIDEAKRLQSIPDQVTSQAIAGHCSGESKGVTSTS